MTSGSKRVTGKTVLMQNKTRLQEVSVRDKTGVTSGS